MKNKNREWVGGWVRGCIYTVRGCVDTGYIDGRTARKGRQIELTG